MQTKTNDDPLKKMSKSTMWDLGIAGASALGAAFGIPPSLTSAAGGALKGQLYDEKNEAGYVDPNLIANQEAQYQANLSNLGKTGKVLKPITSYYGEAKNLSSLTYKDSILMKTVSGVNTLKKENETDPPNRKVIEDRGRGMGGITQDTITGKFYSQTFPNQEMDSTHIRNPFDPSIVDVKWLPKKDENN